MSDDKSQLQDIKYFSVCLYKTHTYEIPAVSEEEAIQTARRMFNADDMGVNEPEEEFEPVCMEMYVEAPFRDKTLDREVRDADTREL
jgi:hypothetical protein